LIRDPPAGFDMGSSALLGVPVYTFSAHKGMGAAPDALRKAGLVSALRGPKDGGNVGLTPLKSDSAGPAKNLDYFRDCTARIQQATKALVADQIFLVGGECSLSPGSLAGLTEAFGGKAGMLWMDAHGDFNTPETSPSGYIGGMCLAMACGRGPSLGESIDQRRPLVAEERLVHVGSRALDPPEVLAFNSSPAKLFTAQQVKKNGAADAAEEAARHLANRSDWIVCHLDVDVVDPSILPAVSYPTPGGLTVDEASLVVRTLMKTGKMKVLDLAAYNPSKDRGGASAKVIVDLARRIFS
jgi:arginase